MKITFGFSLGGLFLIAIIIASVTVYELADSFNHLHYVNIKIEDTNPVETIKVLEPIFPIYTVIIGLPLFILDVIIFVWVYLNEDCFPINLGKQQKLTEVAKK